MCKGGLANLNTTHFIQYYVRRNRVQKYITGKNKITLLYESKIMKETWAAKVIHKN